MLVVMNVLLVRQVIEGGGGESGLAKLQVMTMVVMMNVMLLRCRW